MIPSSSRAIWLRRFAVSMPLFVLAALLAFWLAGPQQGVRAALPAVTLETVEGTPYPLAQANGKIRLVELVYTRCPDVCPTTTVKMVQLQKRLLEAGAMGTKIEFLTVTIDPINDTPEVLRTYAKHAGIDGRGWTLLRGDEETTGEVLRSLGFFARKAEDGFIAHTSSTYLVDEHGQVVRKFGMGEDFDPERIYEEIVTLLEEKEG